MYFLTQRKFPKIKTNLCALAMVHGFNFFINFVLWGELCLHIGLSVFWLGVMLTSGFVCFWVVGLVVAYYL